MTRGRRPTSGFSLALGLTLAACGARSALPEGVARGDGGDAATAPTGGTGGTGGTTDVRVVTSVAVGDLRTCAVISDGSVRCWGLNEHGSAGYGRGGPCDSGDVPCKAECCVGDDEAPADAPFIDVGGRVIQLSAGERHTCAVLDNGAVRCWGISAALGYGNLNDIGDDESPAAAGDVDVGGSVTQIVAGNGFTCALLVNGRVRCWGFGRHGRLGYGNTATIGDDETPASAGDVDVGGTVVELAAGGRHCCALLDSGGVRCWGYGASGALGYASIADVGDDEVPASLGDVAIGGRTVHVSAGEEHTCALLDGGEIKCWGDNVNAPLGQPSLKTGCFSCGPGCCLGDDESPAALGAIDVGGPARAVATGRFHVCALLDGGQVRCWGSGQNGMLGYANTATVGDDETPAAAGNVSVL